MTRAIAIAAALASSIALAQQQPPPTVAQFYLYQVGDAEARRPLEQWLQGYAEAAGMMHVMDRTSKRATDFCLPNGFKIRAELANVTSDYLVAYPKLSGLAFPMEAPLSAAVHSALVWKFPCSKARP